MSGPPVMFRRQIPLDADGEIEFYFAGAEQHGRITFTRWGVA